MGRVLGDEPAQPGGQLGDLGARVDIKRRGLGGEVPPLDGLVELPCLLVDVGLEVQGDAVARRDTCGGWLSGHERRG